MEVDPYWGGGSLDCSKLVDGSYAWSSSSGAHVSPDGSVTVSWPDIKLVETIVVYQLEGYQHTAFELQVQSLTTSAWTTVLAQTSWSQTAPGLTQNGHDTTFDLPEPMLTKAIRFQGTRGIPGLRVAPWFRLEEIDVSGCTPPPSPPQSSPP